MLINRPSLNILSLEGLGLPWWWLSVGWDGRLKVRWLERASEWVPSKIWILPGRNGMVYGIVPLFLLLLFFEDSFESFLVWAIV
jgi:hypothetical protein